MNFEELKKQIPVDDKSAQALYALLALPEDRLKAIAPSFLESFERSIKQPNYVLTITQALNNQGLKIEDFANAMNMFVQEVEKTDELNPTQKDLFAQICMSSLNAVMSAEGVAKRVIEVAIEKCHSDAKIPAYAHPTDAGADVYATEDVTLRPGEQTIIDLGIKLACPPGYAILVHPRSGLSAKTKMRVCNSVGIVDSSYRNNVGVIVENNEAPIKDITYEFDEDGRPVITSILHGADLHITKGERIAQLRLVEVPAMHFYEVSDINTISGDRNGGFGSSGSF